MDWASAIKSDIDSKKRSLDTILKQSTVSSDSSNPPSKYIKRGDLERQRAEAAAALDRAAKATSAAAAAAASSSTSKSPADTATSLQAAGEVTLAAATELAELEAAADSKPEAFNVSNEEAVRRLRGKGQPIRLFGETDKERRLRLRALELIEERTEGQRNDFARAMDSMDKGMELRESAKLNPGAEVVKSKNKGKGKGKDEGPNLEGEDGDDQDEVRPKDQDVLVDMSLVKTNPHKVYPQIYHALKRVLKEWEQSLHDRPEAVRRSAQGKIAAATQQTSADYLKPLFKSLRKRDLAPDVLQAIAEITYNMQVREYLKANDAYLRLSIGNAPWPIGVTMVGIHERSGREKIFSNNVAHVLNDETSRKYIQSIKRLLTFAQTVRPPSDLSQLMG